MTTHTISMLPTITTHSLAQADHAAQGLHTPHTLCLISGNNPCNGILGTTSREINAHLREHGIQCGGRDRLFCPWLGCTHPRPLRRMNLARHILERHVGTRVVCQGCGRTFSRRETLLKHQRACIEFMFVSGVVAI